MTQLMACPICAWSPDSPVYSLLYETDTWRVVLAPNQALVGRCILHLKRHCGDLAELTADEVLDWLAVVKIMENALRTAFDATLFNVSRYMNHAYRENPPDPHIHWWLVPRYNHKVELQGWSFEDPEFGNPYRHDLSLEVPESLHGEIGARIRLALQNSRPRQAP